MAESVDFCFFSWETLTLLFFAKEKKGEKELQGEYCIPLVPVFYFGESGV